MKSLSFFLKKMGKHLNYLSLKGGQAHHGTRLPHPQRPELLKETGALPVTELNMRLLRPPPRRLQQSPVQQDHGHVPQPGVPDPQLQLHL